VRSQNPGVAFGMFAETSSQSRTPILIGLSVIAVLLLAWMLWRIDRLDTPSAAGLALIAFTSLLFVPFTEQYARESVPQQFWHSLERLRAILARSGLAGQALQCPSPGRVKTRHLLREVTERDLSVLLDKPFDLRLRPQGHVLIAVVGGGVVVGLALPPADQDAFLVQAGHDRHIRRVGALFLRVLVERLHHGANRSLSASPELLHHL